MKTTKKVQYESWWYNTFQDSWNKIRIDHLSKEEAVSYVKTSANKQPDITFKAVKVTYEDLA